MLNKIEKAKVFAYAAHAAIDQRRKYTNESYFVHVAEVANILIEHGYHDENMIAAAYLHDTVEDTKISIDDIFIFFGDTIGEYVYYLTDISKKENGNRAIRKEIDRNHNCSGPIRACIIKIADLISNTNSIVACDEKFATIYIKEKYQLLMTLKEIHPKIINTEIFKTAMKLTEENAKKLDVIL